MAQENMQKGPKESWQLEKDNERKRAEGKVKTQGAATAENEMSRCTGCYSQIQKSKPLTETIRM